MQMNQLEVGINSHGEILLRQASHGEWENIRITIDQAEMVAEEIKKIAKQLIEKRKETEAI